MFEPIRGGTRGGQAEFKWADVSADKDREHYLGHSINAPTGRWQKNKDVHWYNREGKQTETERQAEIRRVKEAEEDALAVALGYEPAVRNKEPEASAAGPSTSPPAAAVADGIPAPDVDERRREKEERKLKKLEKKAKRAEKKARKEAKRLEHGHRSDSDHDSHRRGESREPRRSRSRSPPRRLDSRGRDSGRILDRYSPPPQHRRRLSASPRRNDSREDFHARRDYDLSEMERERDADRRRWEENMRRNEASQANRRRGR